MIVFGFLLLDRLVFFDLEIDKDSFLFLGIVLEDFDFVENVMFWII